MLDNSGKVNIIVVLLIIIIQLLISGGIYFLFLKDNIQTDDNKGSSALAESRVEIPQPAQQVRQSERYESSSNQSSPSGSFFDDSQDFGAKDYERDFALLKLDDIIINPSGAESRFFVVTITFEYRQSDKKLPAELGSKTALIKDRIISYFSKLTVDEIKDLNNRNAFKMDVMRITNNLLINGRITDVLFDQFIVQ